MTGRQLSAFDGVPTRVEHEADLRGRQDDPTPRLAVRSVLETVLRAVGDPGPLRVLDVCAGYGVWASEMRRLAGEQGWPVHTTGVEVDERKREHLEKWCDEVRIGDWRDTLHLAEGAEMGEWDLVIGNPHFSELVDDDPDRSMPAVLLRHAPAVLLLHEQRTYTKSAARRRCWREVPPAAVWLLPPIGFRGDGKTAPLTYQATLWLRGHKGPAQLDMLPDPPNGCASYQWRQLPGTEDVETVAKLGLPMAPGYARPERKNR